MAVAHRRGSTLRRDGSIGRSTLHPSTEERRVNRSRHDLRAIYALTPVFAYFVAAGVATVMLGPLLPALMQHWHIRDAQAGTLFTASFLGQLCGSWLAPRNLKASILYGAAVPAAGCAVLMWMSFGAVHLVVFAIGLGIGGGLAAGNVIAGTAFPLSRVRLLTLLNVAWGAGAVACPLLIRATAASGVERFLHLAAACLGLSAVLSAAMVYRAPFRTIFRARSPLLPGKKHVEAWSLSLPGLLLPVFCVAVFFYVGVENSLGGWLPSYAIRNDPSSRASSISFLFWTSELSGRVLMAATATLISAATLYRLSAAVLLAVELALCLVGHPADATVRTLTILGALSLAPLYPLILSFLLARTEDATSLGFVFAAASCGGAVLPWLTGVTSTHYDGLRIGLMVPASGAVFLLLLSSRIASGTSARSTVPS